MRNKKESKIEKILLTGILLIGLILLMLIPVGLAAQEGGGGNESLQEELNNLTSQLTAEGYSWLVNYSIEETAEIEVYRENDNELITTIENIGSEALYKTYLTSLNETESYKTYLTSLNETESHSTWDLRIMINEKEVRDNV